MTTLIAYATDGAVREAEAGAAGTILLARVESDPGEVYRVLERDDAPPYPDGVKAVMRTLGKRADVRSVEFLGYGTWRIEVES